MRSSRSSSGAVALALLTLLVSGLGASGQRGARRQAVYVVAVKDSAVLTMCPALREATMTNGRTWKPDGRAIVASFTDDLQLLNFPRRVSPPDDRRAPALLRKDPRFHTERSPTQVILPIQRQGTHTSPVATELGGDLMSLDSAVKRFVELELMRLGTHEIAASVDKADLVLLVDGSYVSLAASMRSDAGKIPGTGDKPPPALVRSIQRGDWQRNLLQSVLAIAVPGDVYRTSPGDIHALMSVAIWEGSEVVQAPYQVRESFRATDVTRWETSTFWEPASPAALIWQFAGMKPRPASHLPLCSASSQIFRVPAAAAGVPVAPASSAGDRTSVTVPVSVTDGDGRPILDLEPSHFRIYEEDTIQTIDRVSRPGGSVDVILLVDTSSSMNRQADEMQAAIVAAAEAFGRIGTPVTVSFDRRVMLHATPPDVRDRRLPGTNQPPAVVGRAATRFYDALDLLLTGPLRAPSTRTALVILTDGVDTASRLADAETARRRLGASDIPAYVIRYDTSTDNGPVSPNGGITMIVNGVSPEMKRTLLPEDAADPRPFYARAAAYLRELTEMSGGRLVAAPAPDDLEKTFAEIANELRQQYTVTFTPANHARDGAYRRIRVEVDRPGAKVWTRSGFYRPAAGDLARRD